MSFAALGLLEAINGTCQTVSYDGSTATTTAWTRSCAIEVTPTTDCHMNHATSPTATTADLFLAAGVPRQFPARVGEKFAFIKASGSSAGNAYCTEVQS